MRFGKERLRAISEAVRSKFVCPHCKAPQPN
jgi:DNA-directed RNA polymerase II subunit RPB1